MLSGDMARSQIADRVREAETDRIARSTRKARTQTEKGFVRRFGRAALAAALSPIKH